MRLAWLLLVPATLLPASARAVPNPAAVFCAESGGRYEMREEAAGVRGVCMLPDGEEVDAFEHFRREHGQEPAAGGGDIPWRGN